MNGTGKRIVAVGALALGGIVGGVALVSADEPTPTISTRLASEAESDTTSATTTEATEPDVVATTLPESTTTTAGPTPTNPPPTAPPVTPPATTLGPSGPIYPDGYTESPAVPVTLAPEQPPPPPLRPSPTPTTAPGPLIP